MKRLLALYPRAWRSRYEAEMAAVLDDLSFNLRIAVDLTLCAADAHLHPLGARAPRPRLLPIGRTALLALVGLLALSLLSLAERMVPAILGAADGGLLWPIALPLLGVLAAGRAGWPLVARFCGFLALMGALADGLLVELQFSVRPPLEPLRAAVAAWHPVWLRLDWLFTAAVLAAGVVLLAAALRRLGIGWPLGLAVGLALFASAHVWEVLELAPLRDPIWASHPTWFRLAWLVPISQSAGWAALAAILLRRSGRGWPAAVTGGAALSLLSVGGFSATQSLVQATYPYGLLAGFVTTWQLPAALWAAVLTSLADRQPAVATATP